MFAKVVKPLSENFIGLWPWFSCSLKWCWTNSSNHRLKPSVGLMTSSSLFRWEVSSLRSNGFRGRMETYCNQWIWWSQWLRSSKLLYIVVHSYKLVNMIRASMLVVLSEAVSAPHGAKTDLALWLWVPPSVCIPVRQWKIQAPLYVH